MGVLALKLDTEPGSLPRPEDEQPAPSSWQRELHLPAYDGAAELDAFLIQVIDFPDWSLKEIVISVALSLHAVCVRGSTTRRKS